MIPNVNVIHGDVKVTKLIDTRGVVWSPFFLPENMPKINPFTYRLLGEWEDGYHFIGDTEINRKTKLIHVENNEVIAVYEVNRIK